MIELTERQLAEKRLENVKGALIDSKVDYYLNETPYTLAITIKKKLLKDFSSKNANLPTRLPYENMNSQPSSPNSSFQSSDSGFQSEVNEKFEHARKELQEKENTIVKLNNKISEKDRTISDLNDNLNSKESIIADLKNNNGAKDSIISKLNAELNSLKDTSNNLKKESNIKSEQLKQKNKSIENLKSKHQQDNTEYSKQVDNLNIKLEKSENINKKLSTENKKLSTDLESMMHEHKRIADEKQKRQEKSTQIENRNESKYVQTDAQNHQTTVKAIQPSSKTNTASDSFVQTNDKSKPTLIQCRLLLDILFPHPSLFNQLKWPDKSVLDKYRRMFGNHQCEDCIMEDISYKLVTGTQTSYRGENLPICRNNLVPFNGQNWWE